MARYLCDFYVYKTPQQLVAKFVNAILTQGEAQASANAFLKQYSAARVCVVNKGEISGPPRAPIKTAPTALPNAHCWVQAPQVAAQTVTCPPGYVFENGKCVLKSPIPPKCPPGTQPVDNLCVPEKKLKKPVRTTYSPPVIAGPFDSLSETMEELGGDRHRDHPHKPLKSPSHRLDGFPFVFGVGEPVSTVAKYKAILVAWGNTPGVSKPVPNYGTVADDIGPTWNCLREGRMLSAFSKWWNSKGNKLSEGSFPTSGSCKGILVAELDAPHMAALDAFAAGATNVVVPGGGWACPAGQLWNPITGKCELIPIIPISWPGGDQPPGGGLPPPPVPVTPPGGGVPPITPGVTDCDGKNPCPAGQVCVGGKCQPALPPPPSKPSEETKSGSSNVGWWVAGGVAAVGLLALVFGGGKSSALLMNPYSRPGERVRHLQYREAIAAFKRRYAGPKNDKPRMGEAWSRYIDELAREGLITEAQASRWDNPFYR